MHQLTNDERPPSFHIRPNPDDARLVWRYMDPLAFVWMTARRSLFFARADHLGDEWEGSTTAGTRAQRLHRAAMLEDDSLPDAISEYRSRLRRDVAINCWHMSEHEDMAMWRIYGDRGLAVVSTIGALADSLRGGMLGTKQGVLSGEVWYLDPSSEEELRDSDPLVPFFIKHRAFSAEREYRLAFHRQSTSLPNPGVAERGEAVPVELEELVRRVVVNPLLEDHERDSLTHLVGLTGFTPEVSELVADPSY